MDLGNALAAGGAALLIGVAVYAAVTIAVMALGIWLTYTIIWRAVRRGLREFYFPPSAALPANRAPEPMRRTPGPRDW